MEAAVTLLSRSAAQVWATFLHNWYFLVLGALIATAIKRSIKKDQVSAFLQRHRRGSIFAATAVAVATPLCSCGTTAVILGMLASTMPWAPIVAFMVSSPLTSPTELFYSAGLFGWPFALTFFAASIGLGLAGGFVAMFLESLGLLEGQARVHKRSPSVLPLAPAEPKAEVVSPPKPAEFALEAGRELRRLLLFFFAFAFVGYALNALIPTEYVTRLFGAGTGWGVPLAATIGLPLYVSSEASLPLVRAFMDNGASAGATLAFLITGAGTSVGALAGALTIARWRVVAIVVATLWVGATAIGYAYDWASVLA